MGDIKPIEVAPDIAELLRSAQDMSDAIAYAFAVPSMVSRPMRLPVFVGIDWAKYGEGE